MIFMVLSNRPNSFIALLSCLVVLGFCADGLAKDRHGAEDAIYPEKHLGEFYDRLAGDLKAGKPMVVTAYVALCDNDSQGIIPTRNRSICMGDYPEKNLYWASSGGLKGHLTNQGWKRVLYQKSQTDKIAVTGVWTRRLPVTGALRERGITGSVPVYIVGLGYRGTRIHDAMVDYLHAVNRDNVSHLTLKGGDVVAYGGQSHVVGYIGHDYFMDVHDESLLAEARGNSAIHKAVFGLACVSDKYFRPAVQRRNTHIVALNTQLTYPSAFTVLGLVRALAEGKDLPGIHKVAARTFAKGQGRTIGAMLKALSYGDKEIPKQSVGVP
jgi:hypothetical protein